MNPICIACQQFKPPARSPSALSITENDPHTIECPRCGRYKVSGELLEDFPNGLPEDIGLKLSAALREATDSRVRHLLVTQSYEAIAAAAPQARKYGETVDLLLTQIAGRCKYPGALMNAMGLEPLAARAMLPLHACEAVLEEMAEAKLLDVEEYDPLRFQARPTSKGWRRVDELQSASAVRVGAFVAMAFHVDMKPVYEQAIRPALVGCGYEPPFRVDDLEHEARADHTDFKNKIDDRIMAEIRRARFVVADVTHARPAVYFEAGFAEGLGIPIIWTCRIANKADMCFDTRQNGHILWDSVDALRVALVDKIRARNWDRTRPG
jgi:hypothetical protein